MATIKELLSEEAKKKLKERVKSFMKGPQYKRFETATSNEAEAREMR